MNNPTPPKIPISQSIRRLLQLAGKNQAWFYLALLAAVLSTAITLAWNFSLARVVDAVSARQPAIYMRYLWLTMSLIGLSIPLDYVRTFCNGLFSERTLARLRGQIAAQAAALPMRYLEERHTGDLLAVVNADLAKLKDLTASALLGVISQTVMALAALGALFAISWPLALVSTLMIPFMFVVMGKLSQPIAQRTQEMQQAIGDTVSLAQDGLGGLMVTKAFNLQAVMSRRYQGANQRALGKGLSLSRLQAVTDGSGSMFNALPFLVTFGFGGYLAISGNLTFGGLIAFINLLNFVANPLSSLPSMIASLGESSGAAQRIFQILDQARERTGGQEFPLDEGVAEVVRYDHLDFGYDHEAVLHEVSLQVGRGQTVAVVGPSGGGKSTLLKLLLGFYPLEDGRLFLFEADLNRWLLAAAREQMAFVAQDTYLFPVSIAENIACGKPGASQAQIEQAARLANIHETITSLPEGYRTLAGERGAHLSGGQRQRLALARAILKDAPILLLDEPTSALDAESEALVQEALDRFMVNRTTIVIAHRLSTIREADRVVVLEGGRIVEEGSHADLLARGGRYKELYLRQFSEAGPAT
jgi:ABC-type multidrug transport system fused ATPase/permease subunit